MSQGHGNGHPFLRTYGANLPSSLSWICPEAPLVINRGTPVMVLGTITDNPVDSLFMDSKIRSNPPYGRP